MGRPLLPHNNLIGKTFGRLTVLCKVEKPVHLKSHGKSVYWKCRCTCGTLVIVRGDQVGTSRTVSCGCKRKEYLAGNTLRTGSKNPMWRGGRKAAQLRINYGITLDNYDEIARKQGDRCAICKNPRQSKEDYTTLAVDHDHGTMMIRGLLCTKCNTGVAMFNDSVPNALAAVRYLANPIVTIPVGGRARRRTT